MSYQSPFGAIDSDDHNGPDALCLSRTHCVNATEDTIAEFHQVTVAAIDARTPQPAFFLARQLAELGLKALPGMSSTFTHKLTKLLEILEQRGDELLGGGEEQNMIVAFIRDLDTYDPEGDQGRYPTKKSGDLSLATVCCADPTLLREHVDRLYGYIRNRIAASPALTNGRW